jgi:hypothetical protein
MNAALYDENSRLRLEIINLGTENAQLKRALDKVISNCPYCPPVHPACAEEDSSREQCYKCIEKWAME